MNPIYHRGYIYKRHPIFHTYAASERGFVIDINKKVEIKAQHHNGNSYLDLKMGVLEKMYESGQFVWECFNGIIPVNGVIKNINGDYRRRGLHNFKLVMKIINREPVKFHPFYILYSSNTYGCIFDINEKSCIEILGHNGYLCVNLK